MKRTFTLNLILMIGSFSFGQYFSDEWASGTLTGDNAWTTYTTDGGYDWTADDAGSAGNFYAMMTNFDGTNHAVTAWLITPAIDLTSSTSPVLSFRNAYNYAGDALELYICTDYTGGDPASDGSWTDHTGDAAWSPGSFTWTTSGEIDLSSYSSSSTVYIGFKYTGTASDGSKWEIDDFLVDEVGSGSAGFVSIYDIQYSTATPAESPEMGNEVTTHGLVTGVILNGPDSAAYFMQDGDGAWNGIYVYDTDATVAIGDSVEVTGTVDEFNLGSSSDGVTEIKDVSSYTVLNSGNPAPSPTDVTTDEANDEEWEGVLINLVSGECTNNSEGFGLWSIDDGSGVIKGDDDIFAYHLTAVVGNWYQVTGIGHYTFDEAKILPRNIGDITQTGWNSIDENENKLVIYPNPASNYVTISASKNAKITMMSLTGEKIYSGTNEGQLNVSEVASGIYQLIIEEKGIIFQKRLIVR